jgi:pilus assembly protein CpaE
VVESCATGNALLAELDALADVCDPDTRVVLIGAENDIGLYRTLLARGIAEYLVGPITPLTYVATVQRLFAREPAGTVGKTVAVIGAKGGVGASMLAQNLAWTLAEEQRRPTLLLDLDLRFGSAAINLDLRPATGVEKYLTEPGKLDSALLDRLIVARGDYLSVLPGPRDPLGDFEPEPEALEQLLAIARRSFPQVVMDLPCEWSAATREALTSADEVLVVASPDLVNLRNAKALLERLRSMRPNDAPPRLLLNACRVPRRREIDPAEFAESLGVAASGCIAFDPGTFGAAAAEGRTIREQAPRSAAQKACRALARELTGQEETRRRSAESLLRKALGLGRADAQV